jgi:hypothetical protein
MNPLVITLILGAAGALVGVGLLAFRDDGRLERLWSAMLSRRGWLAYQTLKAHVGAVRDVLRSHEVDIEAAVREHDWEEVRRLSEIRNDLQARLAQDDRNLKAWRRRLSAVTRL